MPFCLFFSPSAVIFMTVCGQTYTERLKLPGEEHVSDRLTVWTRLRVQHSLSKHHLWFLLTASCRFNVASSQIVLLSKLWNVAIFKVSLEALNIDFSEQCLLSPMSLCGFWRLTVLNLCAVHLTALQFSGSMLVCNDSMRHLERIPQSVCHAVCLEYLLFFCLGQCIPLYCHLFNL